MAEDLLSGGKWAHLRQDTGWQRSSVRWQPFESEWARAHRANRELERQLVVSGRVPVQRRALEVSKEVVVSNCSRLDYVDRSAKNGLKAHLELRILVERTH